ncbi:MAG: hypothetical protein AB8B61_06520 [Cyclobacteriaceae bacterium]
MKNPELKIFAGPDSLDDFNIDEVYQIAEMKANGKQAVFGTRTVGLKSRTNFDGVNSDGGFMGYDFDAIMKNFDIFGNGGNADDLVPLPTVQMAEKIYKDTGLMCSTEIMLPAIQLTCIKKSFADSPFMVWNSAVDQLGWHLRQMGGFAQEHGWSVGIKNGKWLGEDYTTAESPKFEGKTNIEVVWDGLANYASLAPEVNMIQRGCTLPLPEGLEMTGDYHKSNVTDLPLFRSLPVHYMAKRTKIRHAGDAKVNMYFDPSHSVGPKLRDKIVDLTVEAMKMKVSENEYLYDGVLIESGTAKCDTHQHITVAETQELIDRLAEFRTLVGAGETVVKQVV